MVCSFCQKNECEGYLKWYCSDCSRLKRLINLHGDRVYEILDNVLLRTEDKQRNKEVLEIQKEVKEQEKKLEINLNESCELYENNNNKQLLTELKQRINKKK